MYVTFTQSINPHLLNMSVRTSASTFASCNALGPELPDPKKFIWKVLCKLKLTQVYSKLTLPLKDGGITFTFNEIEDLIS